MPRPAFSFANRDNGIPPEIISIYSSNTWLANVKCVHIKTKKKLVNEHEFQFV
jgi:hypothetical protein